MQSKYVICHLISPFDPIRSPHLIQSWFSWSHHHLTDPWSIILQDGSKTKRSTAEVQVGFLGFVAHSAHQILGHVQAAQLRAMAVSMDGAVKFVKIPWGFR